VLDSAGVKEKFGVPPDRIADYLALIGDTSDNIPGVDGVGPKTAAKWFAEFGSLEGIIAHAAELKPDRFREVVAAQADNLRRNLKLTILSTKQPLPMVAPAEPQTAKLVALMEAHEMKSTAAEAQRRYAGQRELF